MSVPYINHASPIIFAGPYSLLDTKLFLFPLCGDKTAIQATVDSFFKDLLEGSHIRYEVFASHVFIGAAYMNAVSDNPEVKQIFGGFDEVDYAVWVPLLKWEYGIPVGFYWFMSFVLVDNPLAIATGREVFGFQKNQGVFTPPAMPPGPIDFAASAWSLQTYSPDSRVKLFPLFSMKKTQVPVAKPDWLDEALGLISKTAHALEKDFAALRELASTAQGFVRLFHASLSNLKMPMVFLKQFRSATNTVDACCQGVVETNFVITDLAAVKPILHQYQFSFQPNATYDLARDYGLSNNSLVEFSVEVDMSFNLPMGKIVFP